jgi:hypothetical protein
MTQREMSPLNLPSSLSLYAIIMIIAIICNGVSASQFSARSAFIFFHSISHSTLLFRNKTHISFDYLIKKRENFSAFTAELRHKNDEDAWNGEKMSIKPSAHKRILCNFIPFFFWQQ